MKNFVFALAFLSVIESCTYNDLSFTKYSTNIYVAGYETNLSHAVAKYWKNGFAIPLSEGTSNSYSTGIVIVDNDVYVAGYELVNAKYRAKYWKNGVSVLLTDGSNDAQATAVIADKNDI